MPLERKIGESRQVFQKAAFYSAAAQIAVNDLAVVGDTSGAAVTLTLPPVVEAIGKIYSFRAPSGLTNALTIADNGDSIGWTNIALSTNGATAVLYSDGFVWHRLV